MGGKARTFSGSFVWRRRLWSVSAERYLRKAFGKVSRKRGWRSIYRFDEVRGLEWTQGSFGFSESEVSR